MALRQQEPMVPPVLDQPAARLHGPLPQPGQGPTPATASPGCTRSRSDTAEPRSNGSGGNSAVSSSVIALAVVRGARGRGQLGCVTSIGKRVAALLTAAKSISHQWLPRNLLRRDRIGNEKSPSRQVSATWAHYGLITVVSGVPGHCDVLAPSPARFAVHFLPVGNQPNFLLTTCLPTC